MYVCMCISISTASPASLHPTLFIHTCICTYIYMYMKIHVYVSACIYIYIYKYAHVYVYVYIHNSPFIVTHGPPGEARVQALVRGS